MEDAVIQLNFLNNDSKKAYCLRGTLDICLVDFETDLYKIVVPGGEDEADHQLNVFENGDGEAFFGRKREAGESSNLIELRKITGEPLALVEGAAGVTRVALIGRRVVGICGDNSIQLFEESGTKPWKVDPIGVKGMMEEEIIHEDDDTSPGRGLKLGRKKP